MASNYTSPHSIGVVGGPINGVLNTSISPLNGDHLGLRWQGPLTCWKTGPSGCICGKPDIKCPNAYHGKKDAPVNWFHPSPEHAHARLHKECQDASDKVKAHAITDALVKATSVEALAAKKSSLPTDSAARKDTPIFSGVLRYFPLALAEVARLSKTGNDKHNPGQPLHWSRDKSTDHADCIVRHQMEVGTVDEFGFLHEVSVAWRALAQLQIALEAKQ